MLKKMNKCLFLFLFIFLSNMAFASGIKDLYTDAHSEEWIREAILAHPNVKEIARMYYLQTNKMKYRIYLIMKDDTKIILDSVRILKDNSIICDFWRIGDYTDPKMLVYHTTSEKYYCGNISAGYDNEKFQEYMDSRDINLVLDNYKEFENYFSSMPCLSEEDINLLNERREKEIKVLQNVCWEKVRKNYTYYVVLKADDVSWSQWKVE